MSDKVDQAVENIDEGIDEVPVYSINFDEMPEALSAIVGLYEYLHRELPAVRAAIAVAADHHEWHGMPEYVARDLDDRVGSVFATVHDFIAEEHDLLHRSYDTLDDEYWTQFEAEHAKAPQRTPAEIRARIEARWKELQKIFEASLKVFEA